jgi:hypothetical protein
MTSGTGWWTDETPPDPAPVAGTAAKPAQDAQDGGAQDGDAQPAREGGAQAMRDSGAYAAPDSGTHPARLALGMAVLAAERLRPGSPANDAFATGVGLLQHTAAEARTLVRRVMRPSMRIASRTVDIASYLSGSDSPRRSLSRSREIIGRVVSEARRRGEATVAAGRADATAFVEANVNDGIAWAQTRVVPRLIDGALPEIRARILPVVIEDLTNDPRVRELVLEQSEGVVNEATQHLRSTTAAADNRVESAFRRFVHGRAPSSEPPATEQ